MKEISLGHGKYALVDDEDYDKVSGIKWQCIANGYAFSSTNGRKTGTYYMHKLILPCDPGMQVDHISRDRLDNRRCNLRMVTPQQNSRNCGKRKMVLTSPYKGVSWVKDRKKWTAHLTHNYENIYLGIFVDEQEAARAYDKKAKELFGEFANLNFPEA